MPNKCAPILQIKSHFNDKCNIDGKRVVFRKTDLLEWLDGGRRQTLKRSGTMAYLRNHLEKQLSLPDKKEDPSILDKLMLFLPSIITIVGMFMMYRKFDPNHDQDPVQKEINKVFKTLDPKNREEMTKALMEAVGRFSDTPKAQNKAPIEEKHDQNSCFVKKTLILQLTCSPPFPLEQGAQGGLFLFKQ